MFRQLGPDPADELHVAIGHGDVAAGIHVLLIAVMARAEEVIDVRSHKGGMESCVSSSSVAFPEASVRGNSSSLKVKCSH